MSWAGLCTFLGSSQVLLQGAEASAVAEKSSVRVDIDGCFIQGKRGASFAPATSLQPGVVEMLVLTPVASDPLSDVRRAIPKPDPCILATREELDCLRVHESNFSEIQKQPAPCRFLAQQAPQLGHCLSVDPTTHQIKDPSPW